jgi:hypothetical protein
MLSVAFRNRGERGLSLSPGPIRRYMCCDFWRVESDQTLGHCGDRPLEGVI